LFTIFLSEGFEKEKTAIIKKLQRLGIEIRPIFYPINQMPIYKDFINENDCYPVSEKLFLSGISLPSSASITISEIERITNALHSVFLRKGEK
jgi:perosamine synthetase